MATDGLLPKIFAEVDRKGNLVRGIVISGGICTLIALLVPFKYLDDMISAGVLISFNLTNSSLIIIRRCDNADPYPCTTALILFNICSVLLHVLLVNLAIHGSHILFTMQLCTAGVLVLSLVFCTYYISSKCPENEDPDSVHQFRVPGLPYVPLFGIFVNYLLLAQLSLTGIGLIFCYFGIASVFYFGYGIHNSKGNNTGWREILPEINSDDSVRKYGNMDVDYVSSSHESGGKSGRVVPFAAHSTAHRHENGNSDSCSKIASNCSDRKKDKDKEREKEREKEKEKDKDSISHVTHAHVGKYKASPHSHASLCANGLSSDDDDKDEGGTRTAASHPRKMY